MLSVRVTPRSSKRDLIVDEGIVKVWVQASPTDGQANEAVSRLLAERLGLAPSRVVLVRGETSRNKSFRVEGLSDTEALDRLRT